MQIYEVSIDFASVPRTGKASTSTVAPSLPADRFFSWLSLGWIQLFGLEDYRSTLQAFLSGRPSWRHSDLFLYTGDSVWLPAPRWTQDAALWRKAGRASRPNKNAASEPCDNSDAQGEHVGPIPEGESSSADSAAQGIAEVAEYKVPAIDQNTKQSTSSLRESGSVASPDQLSDANTLVCAEAFIAAVRQGRPIRRHEVLTGMNKESIKDTCSYRGWLSTDDAALIEKLRACIEFMADDGLGANRSTGNGAIKAASISATELFEKLQAGDKRKFTRHVILSACCPTPEFIEQLEATSPGSNSYSLAYNSGWVYDADGRATDVRKPVTCAFETGSVFSCEPEGRLVEVGNEEHTSFRYGFPFVLSV